MRPSLRRRACPRTGDSVRIVETFHDFGAQVVEWVGDVEAVLVVEGLVGGIHTRGVPAENLRSDPREGGGVQIVTAVDERESEIDVILSVQYGASEEEIPAVEAGQMLGRVHQCGVLIAYQERQVRPGGRCTGSESALFSF